MKAHNLETHWKLKINIDWFSRLKPLKKIFQKVVEKCLLTWRDHIKNYLQFPFSFYFILFRYFCLFRYFALSNKFSFYVLQHLFFYIYLKGLGNLNEKAECIGLYSTGLANLRSWYCNKKLWNAPLRWKYAYLVWNNKRLIFFTNNLQCISWMWVLCYCVR